MNQKEINFYLPDFFSRPFYIVNTYFIEKLKNNPEYFYNNIKIGAIYGAFPGTIWNGGRAVCGETKLKEVFETFEHYRKLNIPLRLTYTNNLLTEEHLKDSFANNVTRLGNIGNNEIIINSSILEEYLRKTYPKYKFISSTTKCILNEDDIIKESKNYYLTVIDYRKNIDLNFLSSLPNPEDYEILINSYCDPKCKNRLEHYNKLSEFQINNKTEKYDCIIKKYNFFESLEWPTVIKVEDLYTTYVNMGFKHFKIEGRTDHIIDVIESYLYYMVKPEYKDNIRYEVLKKLL